MKGKIDRIKIIKSVSRKAFAGMDVKTKVVPVKTRYQRKPKHSNCNDW